jgi:hypothetical protein
VTSRSHARFYIESSGPRRYSQPEKDCEVRLFFKDVLLGVILTLSVTFLGSMALLSGIWFGSLRREAPKLEAKKSDRLSPAELEKIK